MDEQPDTSALDPEAHGESNLSGFPRCVAQGRMGSRMGILKRFFGKARSKGEIRRKQTRQRAVAERDRDHRHRGSIWRSGKGGSHIG
jgi:hypothetical protein